MLFRVGCISGRIPNGGAEGPPALGSRPQPQHFQSDGWISDPLVKKRPGGRGRCRCPQRSQLWDGRAVLVLRLLSFATRAIKGPRMVESHTSASVPQQMFLFSPLLHHLPVHRGGPLLTGDVWAQRTLIFHTENREPRCTRSFPHLSAWSGRDAVPQFCTTSTTFFFEIIIGQ